MTRNNILLLTMLAMLAIGTLLGLSCSRDPKPAQSPQAVQAPQAIPLPGSIDTVAAGFPYALKIMDAMEPGGHLTGAGVVLDATENDLRVRNISYGFQSGDTNHILLINLDNTTHLASLLTVADAPQNASMPAFVSEKLTLPWLSNDVPNVLKIAKADKLGEFLKSTPPQTRSLVLALKNGASGPVWFMVGSAGDEKGPVADLYMEVDPMTGAILSHELKKGEGR